MSGCGVAEGPPRRRAAVTGVAARPRRVGAGQGAGRDVRAVGAADRPGIPRPGPGSRPVLVRCRRRGAGRPVTAADHRRVVFPGDPSPRQAAWAQFQGTPVAARPKPTGPARLGLIGDITEVTEAGLIELGCWRTRIGDPPPGPGTGRRAGRPPRPVGPGPADRPRPGPRHRGTGRARPAPPTGSSPGGPTPCWNPSPPATGCCPGCRPSSTPTWPCCPGTTPGWHEMLPTEIAFALRTSESTAGNAISTARAFTDPAARHPARPADRPDRRRPRHGHGPAPPPPPPRRSPPRSRTTCSPRSPAPGSSTTAEQLRRRAARAGHQPRPRRRRRPAPPPPPRTGT